MATPIQAASDGESARGFTGLLPGARRIRYGGAMIDEREIEAVNKVMRTGMIVGENVRSFEKRVAELMGHSHGIMVNSGSSALLLALRLFDLPPKSEVITPVLTFSTDVSSIVHAGHVPVFVDVVLDSYQIDLDLLERALSPKSKAILVPNLLGGIPDWDRLRAFADEHGLLLLEDSCDTLGSSLRGAAPGTRADISVTSFSIFHIITCLGNGGMVAVNSEALWDRGLSMRSWGRSSEKYLSGTKRTESDGRFLEDVDGIPYDGMFIFEDLGYGFIPNEAGAAFGHVQLDKLPMFTELRNTVFNNHNRFFRDYADVFIMPTLLDGVETTWINYPLQLRPETGWSRRELQEHLEAHGIVTRTIFSGNITRQPMMRGVDYRADPAGYPVADQIMRHGVCLPCHPTMTDEDCDYLYGVLRKFVDARR
ncbi:DegT/DnrJ/EryC1/StrS family aminotransferase [Flavisphingomonas formosensis]|uniref:DegT/DnrJ/EryC1/StrS family aminotransferase n=1 Tax=Flavisphingomonas formosensis TaxID=861534 RepID=UPI0012FBA3D9|nr:DegT/DnrJ/EryC1/StrS aminotransferase family protein [Sphingomonas formosensis]